MQLLKHLANVMQRAEGFVFERALVGLLFCSYFSVKGIVLGLNTHMSTIKTALHVSNTSRISSQSRLKRVKKIHW